MAAEGERTPRAPWPRHARLRKQPDIQRCQRKGRRWRMKTMTVCVGRAPAGVLRFGMAVSRKVGNAVVRNKVKRRLRDVFRHLRAEGVRGWEGHDVMILTRPEVVDLDRAQLEAVVREGVQAALDRAAGGEPRRSRSGARRRSGGSRSASDGAAKGPMR